MVARALLFGMLAGGRISTRPLKSIYTISPGTFATPDHRRTHALPSPVQSSPLFSILVNMGKADAGARAAVGDDLAAVLPDGPWHKKAHLVKLNFVVVSLVLFCMLMHLVTCKCKY